MSFKDFNTDFSFVLPDWFVRQYYNKSIHLANAFIQISFRVEAGYY